MFRADARGLSAPEPSLDPGPRPEVSRPRAAPSEAARDRAPV